MASGALLWAASWAPAPGRQHQVSPCRGVAHSIVDGTVLSPRNFRKEILFIVPFNFICLFAFSFEEVIIIVRNSLGYTRKVYHSMESL